LVKHSQIESPAGLTVATGTRRRVDLAGELHLAPSTDSLQSVPTGGAAF